MSNKNAYKPAHELATLIKDGQLSALSLMEETIERIKTRNPSLNAFVFTGFEEALESAREADVKVASGEKLGPLHGVPVAMKDLFDFKPGWVSTLGGVKALKDNVVDNQCAFTERMEAAGAIIVGKTNSPTFGFRGTCDNFTFGPTNNPFNTKHNSGGSSGGSAAAVADGLVSLAEGTDAGGSIRIPSAWCNTYGFKPSFGRSPILIRPNAFGASSPFIHMGPITRTVKDAVIALDVLCGPHAADPLAVIPKEDLQSHLGRNVRGMRVAFTEDFGIFPVDPEIRKGVRATADKLKAAGVSVENVDIDLGYSHFELAELWCRLMAPLNTHVLDSLKQSGVDLLDDPSQLPPDLLRWNDYVNNDLNIRNHYRDQGIRTEIFEKLQSVLGEYDAIISPTLACFPVVNETNGDTKGPTELNGEPVEPLIGWCLTYLANFTGHPAASLPAGLGSNGLPMGLHIMGRSGQDGDVIALSEALETLAPWDQHYEQCDNRDL